MYYKRVIFHIEILNICWYNLDVLICVSVYINFYFLSFYSFYFYSVFYGSCGLVQIKMTMMNLRGYFLAALDINGDFCERAS